MSIEDQKRIIEAEMRMHKTFGEQNAKTTSPQAACGMDMDAPPPATRLLSSVQSELHQRRGDATRNVQRMQRLEALADLLAANPEVARILELKAELGL